MELLGRNESEADLPKCGGLEANRFRANKSPRLLAVASIHEDAAVFEDESSTDDGLLDLAREFSADPR